jgi:hypothetical protein
VRSRAFLAASFVLALAGGLVAAQQAPAKPAPPNVAGKWAMTINMDMGTATPSIEFKQDGEKLTGTYSGRYGDFEVTGTITGTKLTFSFKMGDDDSMVMSFEGQVAADGNSIKGTADMGELGQPTWSAVRAKG